MATQRKLKAVSPPQPEHSPAPDLREAVAQALRNMSWLGESDVALKALALRQAEEIEKAVDRAEQLAELLRDTAGDQSVYKRLQKLEAMCDITKTVGWLGPQLQGVLRDLGGTPAARAAMKVNQPIGGRLAKLRADAADAAGQDDT